MHLKPALVVSLIFANLVVCSQPKHDKIFFENSIMDGHYYYSEAEYSSDCWVSNTQGKLPVSNQNFFTPGNSLEFHYRSADAGHWSATVLYHDIRGIDSFNEANHLSFWLYVTDSTEKESLPVVSLLLTDKQPSEPTNLGDYLTSYNANTWTQIKIPLDVFFKGNFMPAGEIKGVQFSKGTSSKTDGHLYVDQLELLPSVKYDEAITHVPKLLSAKGYERHIDLPGKRNQILP